MGSLKTSSPISRSGEPSRSFQETPVSPIEVTAFPGGESTIFSGRAVGALLNKASQEDLARLNGKVIHTAELAVDYGFTDADGSMPNADFSGVEAAKRCREVMSQPVIQYNLDAELPNPSETNNPDFAGLFPGAKNYKV